MNCNFAHITLCYRATEIGISQPLASCVSWLFQFRNYVRIHPVSWWFQWMLLALQPGSLSRSFGRFPLLVSISQATGKVRQGECVLCIFWISSVMKCSATRHTWSKVKEQALVPEAACVGGDVCSWATLLTKWIKVPSLCFSEPKKMALTESLCTQSIQASGPALLAQASGTVQIMAYLISPMVCLIPPHLHLSIIVWMIWPLPTTTGTHTDTPTTGTSGTETDLWVRHVDFLHCFFFRFIFSV